MIITILLLYLIMAIAITLIASIFHASHWEPRDLWLGLYWTVTQRVNVSPHAQLITITWYLCLVPCFPILWQTRHFIPKPHPTIHIH